MPKPERPTGTISLHTTLPGDIVARVQARLYSPLEGRVPHGAMARLLTQLLQDWLVRQDDHARN